MKNYLPLFIALLLVSFFAAGSVAIAAQPVESSFFSFIPLLSTARNAWLGPEGGSLVCIVIDPSNPAIVYAGSWGTGMYKSSDGGITWQPINVGLDNLYINSLAIDPTQPNVLYAGTYRSQIYKSTDAGQTWAWSGTGIQEQAIVYSIAIDPQNPTTIFIGTRGISNNGMPPWSGIIYQSIDAGATWNPVLQNVGGALEQDWAYSIVVNPQDSNIVYAATHEHGPYRSTNGGVYWLPIPDGISDGSGRALVIDPSTPPPSTIYMAVWHGDGVYISEDGGDLWSLLNNGLLGTRNYGLSMDPSDPQTLYLSTFSNGILRTADGGEHWSPWGLQDDYIYTVAVSPQTSSTLFAGTYGDGLYRSTDSGLTWQHSQTGILNSNVTSVLVSPTDSQTLYASLYGGGVVTSNDGGHTWSEMNTNLGDKLVHMLVLDPAHPLVIYALTDLGGLYRNDLSGGDGWVWVGDDLPLTSDSTPAYDSTHPFALPQMSPDDFPTGQSQVPTAENLLAMVYAPSAANIVYLGTGGAGVYKSLNGGQDWVFSGLGGQYIWSLAVHPTNPNVVYAATSEFGTAVRYSDDGGGSWRILSLYVPAVYTLAVATDGSGTLFAGTSQGIYTYTAANGWQFAGLAGVTITAFSSDPAHPGTMVAGTTSGAYITTDGGLTWRAGPSELTDLTVQAIRFDPVIPFRVYFATKTNGILKAYITR